MAITEKEKERLALEERAQGPKISNNDRLRFIEALLSDDLKTLYRSSQDLMTRSELYNRNFIMRVIDFYDKVTEVFNDSTFVPESEYLTNLHSDFSESISLELGNI